MIFIRIISSNKLTVEVALMHSIYWYLSVVKHMR